MSSTEFRIGLEGGRNSSKVLKPPGGGSSDIFGTSSYGNVQKQDNASTKDRLFTPPEITPTPNKSQGISSIFGNSTTEVTKSGRKKYALVNRNPITGEEIVYKQNDENEEENCNIVDNKETCEPTEDNAVKPVQSSIRIRAPPGGKSTGIF